MTPSTEPTAHPHAASDDARMIAALRRRDEGAFTELVRRHHAGLLRYAAVFVRDRAVAEEVVQETWLGVIRGIDGFAGRSSLTTWIFSILANRARTRGEREARTIPFAALAAGEMEADEPAVDPSRFRPAGAPWAGYWLTPPQPWNAPEERLLAAETREVVARAISELPPVQREVITLRDVIGMEAGEVCGMMGLTDGNQRVLLHRARGRVRRALGAHLAGETGS